MRRSSVLLVFVSMACALSAGWAWQQLRVERRHVAELELRLAARPATQLQRPHAPEPVVTHNVPVAPTPPAVAVAVEADEDAAREKEMRDHLRASQQHQREMMRDPAYRQSVLEEGRRQFARTRADAIRVVGMTAEQADRVIDLWVERNLRYSELVEWGKSPSEAARAEMQRAADAEQAALRELLGSEKYERWNTYLASSGERAEMDEFRLQLSATAEPLNQQQVDVLVEAIYSERLRRSREYEEYAKSAGITNRNVVSAQDRQRWLDLELEANQRIHDSVASTLSQAQLTNLDESLAARLAPVEAELRMQRESKFAKSN